MDYMEVDWYRANCIGTDWRFFFCGADAGFVPGESKTVNKTLRRICSACDILNDCAVYAIEHENEGFWAGMTEGERRSVRNGRKTRPFAA